MDDSDETILHAAARELKEETGLTATHVVRQVTQFTFSDGGGNGPTKTWLKVRTMLSLTLQQTTILTVRAVDLSIRSRKYEGDSPGSC
jgi:8-oxo-dGTP pyrophosphatase MutT (NUDIX family)